MSFGLCYCFLLAALSTPVSFVISQITVTLPSGQVRGKELKTFNNLTFYAYLGIPYATPPLGNLRFQAPIPAQSWMGILEATTNSNRCYQVSVDYPNEDEDCLYINIFTPVLNAHHNDTKLPVMFTIYGGGFISGDATYKYDNYYLLDENIIIVSFNYRIGPFGFLATGDTLIPGNAGLKDQNLALKWTYNNIKFFGGDENKITIRGQSAGGASVGYHILSRKSEGLFRAAIIESGSPLNTWTFQQNPLDYAVELVHMLNSSTPSNASSKYLTEFLQRVPAKQIDIASTKTTKSSGVTLEPNNEDAFLTHKMYELFASGNFSRVPIIIGHNSEEQILMASDLERLKSIAKIYDENSAALLPDYFPLKDGASRSAIGRVIRNVYLPNDEKFENHLGRVIRYSSDNRFTRGIIEQAQLQSNYTDVYFYQFSYKGGLGGIKVSIEDAERIGHGEETKYIFVTKPLVYLSEPDLLTHKRLIKLWTQFVKTMAPNLEDHDIYGGVNVWPPVSSGNFFYLNINGTLSIERDPKGKFFTGWTKIFDDWADRPFTTY